MIIEFSHWELTVICWRLSEYEKMSPEQLEALFPGQPHGMILSWADLVTLDAVFNKTTLLVHEPYRVAMLVDAIENSPIPKTYGDAVTRSKQRSAWVRALGGCAEKVEPLAGRPLVYHR